MAEFKCKKEFGDGNFSNEKSQIEQLKKDLAEAKTKKEEEAKKKTKKTKRKTVKKSNASSNSTPQTAQNTTPTAFGHLEVSSVPPFTSLVIDGNTKKKNSLMGYTSKKDVPLAATTHIVEIYSNTGDKIKKRITIPANGVVKYCWDFMEAAKCKK